MRDIIKYANQGNKKLMGKGCNYNLGSAEIEAIMTIDEGVFSKIMVAFDAGFEAGARYGRKTARHKTGV